MKTKYTLLKHKETGARSARINVNGTIITELENPTLYNDIRKKAMASYRRQTRNSIMQDMGMTRVYGAVSRKIYWE